MRLGVLPFLVTVPLLLTACGGDDDPSDNVPFFPAPETGDSRVRVFDEVALEGPDGIERVLTNDYNVEDVERVDCPADQVVEKGSSFQCEVVAGGRELAVLITVVDDNGAYRVGLPE